MLKNLLPQGAFWQPWMYKNCFVICQFCCSKEVNELRRLCFYDWYSGGWLAWNQISHHIWKKNALIRYIDCFWWINASLPVIFWVRIFSGYFLRLTVLKSVKMFTNLTYFYKFIAIVLHTSFGGILDFVNFENFQHVYSWSVSPSIVPNALQLTPQILSLWLFPLVVPTVFSACATSAPAICVWL